MHADAFAKKGAALHHIVEDELHLIKGLEVVAKEAATWSAAAVSNFIDAGHAKEVDLDLAQAFSADTRDSGTATVTPYGDGGERAGVHVDHSLSNSAPNSALSSCEQLPVATVGQSFGSQPGDEPTSGSAPYSGADESLADVTAASEFDVLDVIGCDGRVLGSNVLRRAVPKSEPDMTFVDTDAVTFHGHELRVLEVESSSWAMYVCRRCWKYAHERWRDLKQPCPFSSESEQFQRVLVNRTARERIFLGMHPDPLTHLAVSNFRTLSERQRRFAAFKMGCIPCSAVTNTSGGSLAATSFVPVGPFLVRSPQHIQGSTARALRDETLLSCFGVADTSDRAAMIELGASLYEHTRDPHPDSDSDH